RAMKRLVVWRVRDVIAVRSPEMHDQEERHCRLSIDPSSNELAHRRAHYQLMRSPMRNRRGQSRITSPEVLRTKGHRVVVQPKALIEAKGGMEARPADKCCRIVPRVPEAFSECHACGIQMLLPGIHAMKRGPERGQHRHVRGHGPGRSGIRAREEGSFACKSVEVRTSRPRVTVAGQMVCAKAVYGDQDHVRSLPAAFPRARR